MFLGATLGILSAIFMPVANVSLWKWFLLYFFTYYAVQDFFCVKSVLIHVLFFLPSPLFLGHWNTGCVHTRRNTGEV